LGIFLPHAVSPCHRPLGVTEERKAEVVTVAEALLHLGRIRADPNDRNDAELCELPRESRNVSAYSVQSGVSASG